jgi:hypothetical protein
MLFCVVEVEDRKVEERLTKYFWKRGKEGCYSEGGSVPETRVFPVIREEGALRLV